MDSPLPSRWKVRIDKARFEKLKSEESFCGLVALSRIVNALRFVHSPLEYYQDDSPGALRVRYNSFLFNCALIYEVSLFINTLGKHYGHLAEYLAMVSPINSQETRDFLRTNLEPVRNRVTFHFGKDEIGAQLRNLNLEEPIFVSGMGAKNANVYYELADLCAMTTFTAATFDTTEALAQIVEPLVKKTSDLTLGFITAAENFIVTALVDSGCDLIEVVPALPIRRMYVLGTNHRLQGAPLYPQAVMDPGYLVEVERIISNESIDLLFEEASGCGPSSAERLVNSLPGIRYFDVDPHLSVREKFGIVDTDGRPFPDEITQELYVEEQEKREELWTKRIAEAHFRSGVLVCGVNHTLSMTFRLRSAGFLCKHSVYVPHEILCTRQHVPDPTRDQT